MAHLDEAIGRERRFTAVVDLPTARAMAATMDWDWPDSNHIAVPALWHWLGTAPIVRHSDIGADGHEKLGVFIPPLPAASRMWASGEIVMGSSPLIVGRPIDICTKIASVQRKSGRTGELYFVELAHSYQQDSAVRVMERQTLVYRPAKPDFPRVTPKPAPEGRIIEIHCINDTQLFRYSALTFNSHRIHLDRRYCEMFEGDPRLVVHGPLLATLLARAAEAVTGVSPRRFAFRAHHPVRENERFHACAAADGHEYWIAGEDGSLRMSATAEF